MIPPALAQRGGRGGGGRGGGGGGFRGGGGGGGFRGGGGGGGGFRGGGGGGGFSRSPAVSSPRPAQRPALAGGAGGRPSTLPSRPSGGVGRPGVGTGGSRPSTLPSRPGLGNRPGIDNRPGIGNRPGIDNRPGIGNRPGIDNRPGIGNRPGIDNRPGIGNRPGIDNRPGIGNRPGIDNRPGGGDDVNRPVDPGYGARPPAYNGWRGAYWGYHQGWANGYWHGYHDNSNWGWGSFALGAATGVTAWALGSSFYNWGYASYANPYYAETAVAQPIVIEQTVAGGEPQTVTVPAYTYDYSQPIDTQSAPPPEEVASPAVAKFDSARAAFGTGDYAGALKLTDEALKVLPNDATLHEFRALVLFAVGKYDLAAGPLYAVLSVGPGWDWTTMAGLYPNIDVYTSQLRKLEAFVCRESEFHGRPFRAGLPLPDPGEHRSGREPAQAGCGPGSPGHALGPARQAVLAAIRANRHPGGINCTGTGCRHPPSKGIWPETGPPTRPAIRRSTCASGTTRPSPGKSPPRASPGNSPGNGHSPITCSRWLRKETQGHWSAVSRGKPTTSGASASSGRDPRIKGYSSPTESGLIRI